MRFVLMTFAIALSISASADPSDAPAEPAHLTEAKQAYTEAKKLGHKASTFLHARTTYRAARKAYLNQPKLLTDYALAYAQAASDYQQPHALKLFQEILNIYVAAYGLNAEELIIPLISAAEEALRSQKTDMAYAWLTKAQKLHGEKADTLE